MNQLSPVTFGSATETEVRAVGRSARPRGGAGGFGAGPHAVHRMSLDTSVSWKEKRGVPWSASEKPGAVAFQVDGGRDESH